MHSALRVCIIQDHSELGERISKLMRERGIWLQEFTAAKDIRADLLAAQPDVLLVDSDVGAGAGAGLVRDLRRNHAFGNRPIIQLVSGPAAAPRKGINTGADIYLRKPFPPKELIYAVESVNSGTPYDTPALHYAGIGLESVGMTASREGRRIFLSVYQFRILRELMRNAERVVSKDDVREAAWNYDKTVTGALLNKVIRSLRRALNADLQPNLIHLVKGRGFVLSTAAPIGE